MNNDRRKRIAELKDQLDNIFNEIEVIKDEEQDYYDNMPDSFRDGEKGQAAEQAVSNLDDALGCVQEACDLLEESMS